MGFGKLVIQSGLEDILFPGPANGRRRMDRSTIAVARGSVSVKTTVT
jgi:hypothetical protein